MLGVPVKATVKESEDGQFVSQTLTRSKLWEIQTPQVMRPQLLREGFRKVRDEYVGDIKCGSTMLVIAGLAKPEFLIEIEAMAAK